MTWGLAIEPAPEGPPLAPLMEALIEESGATPVQGDDAGEDDDAVE